MPRITPVSWKVLACVFEKAGFVFDRQAGSHRTYVKSGVARPVVIPAHKEVYPEIIKSNMKTAGMSREEYFSYLEQCK
ncbi:MAG: type II toxin-antitoxin system HicA family toxin [Pseudomonadota bacterium]|nr:type II toxin-antitoxin system HicA family toxin [Pseudomonadota bacterium]